MNISQVLVFGELLWDIDAPSGAQAPERHLGGAPANLAFHLHQRGGSVKLVTRVGNDQLGREALTILREKGIDLSLVQQDSGATGTVDVLRDGNHVDYLINPNVAYDRIELTPMLMEQARSASIICFGTLVQRSVVTRETLYTLLDHSPTAVKFLDINLRKDCFSAATVHDSISRANILKLNADPEYPAEGETVRVAELLSLDTGTQDRIIDQLMTRYPNLQHCLVTKAAHGVDLYARNAGPIASIRPYPIAEVVDVVGAGDALAGAFLYALANGRPIIECVDFGVRVASIKVGRRGAMAAIDDREIAELSLLPPMPGLVSRGEVARTVGNTIDREISH